MKKWILFFFTLPWTLTVGWGWVFLMCMIGAAHKLKWEGAGVLTATWTDWAVKKWRYSTTLGRGIIYQPGWRMPPTRHPSRIQLHEHVHIRQIEDLMLLGFIIGVIAAFFNPWFGLILWWSSGMWQLPNFITAWLRDGDPYRDSEHERSAYSQTDHL